MYSIDQIGVNSKGVFRILVDILDRKRAAFYNIFNDNTHRLFILRKGIST